MGLLFAQLVNHTQTLQVGTAEQNAVVAVLRYVEEHYRDGSLGEIAAQLHYDLPYLSRLVRRKTGKTYTELLFSVGKISVNNFEKFLQMNKAEKESFCNDFYSKRMDIPYFVNTNTTRFDDPVKQ